MSVCRKSKCVLAIAVMAACLAGCRAPARPTLSTASILGSPAPAIGSERSVKPGINDGYDDPDVEKWIQRFEGESREVFRGRRKIVESVGLAHGSVVADIGSGTGLFTPLFAEAVGADGKVVCVDIVPAFLELTRSRSLEHGYYNVQTLVGDEDSVRLPPNSVDVAFVCDVYHHFEYPRSSLRSIYRALKPGGDLIVIDFERIPGKSRAWLLSHVRAGQDVVTKEVEAAGFELIEQIIAPYLLENYFLRFRKPR